MFESQENDNLTLGNIMGDGSMVLIAEADDATREMIRTVLEEAGFRAVTARDRADLLHKFASLEPALVVLDCVMPDASGIEICRTLRDDPRSDQIPILLTTRVPDPGVIAEAFDAGATDFIPLPFNWSLLPFRVSYLLRAQRVSRRLSFSENRQHVLFDGIPDPVLVYDRDCRIVWANRGSLGTLQRQRAELVGKSCCEIWGEEKPGCEACEIVRCFDAEEVITGTRRSVDGRVWGVRLFPIRSDGGEVENVIKLAHDITDKIRLQAEATRTGQLAAIGELAAGVAHEINNPIHGVINYAQILLNRGSFAGQELELVERIQKEGERVADIVQNLLGFARPANSRFLHEDLLAALEESINLFASKLRKNHIRLQIEACGGPLIVRARKQQLQQVFINLISNARYALVNKTFADPDDRLLVIEVDRCRDLGRDAVALRFTDHGCGIPPEMLGRVLQPFVTTKPAGQGTGLGLSISDTIVREHDGQLRIESEPGNWTRVTLTLPLVVG